MIRYIDTAVKVAAGLSGGLIAVYLVSKYLGKVPERLSIQRVLFGLILGLCGAILLAPIAVELWELKGRVATGVTFLVAVGTEFILVFILKILQAASTNAPAIVKKLLDRYLGKLPDDNNDKPAS